MVHLRAGTVVRLACSCRASVVLSLGPLGAHRRFVVRLDSRGSRCPIAHHRKGGRTLVKREEQGSTAVYRDAL